MHIKCGQSHTQTGFRTPYRNRTETVPKKEKPYRTVRFQIYKKGNEFTKLHTPKHHVNGKLSEHNN